MTQGLTSDLFAAQTGIIERQNVVLAEMKALAKEAENPAVTQARLMAIQQQLDDLKRNYDTLKQINEALKGAMESGSKFLQAR
jgi:uncharacterized protein YigA (DUF484 family)